MRYKIFIITSVQAVTAQFRISFAYNWLASCDATNTIRLQPAGHRARTVEDALGNRDAKADSAKTWACTWLSADRIDHCC